MSIADALGDVLPGSNPEADGPATDYALGADEYVSRRALITLGRRRAPRAEEFARKAWASGDEYRRMAALDVFAAIGSPELDMHVAAAEADGRENLVALAARLRGAGAGPTG